MDTFQLLQSAKSCFAMDSCYSEDKSCESSIIIKGFASTSVVDRDGEYVVSPLEFDLQTFNNAPQLLLNHNYIKTPEGNEVAAGRVLKTIPSYIKMEDPTNTDRWLVFSLLDDAFIDYWLKLKSPLLKQGDSGLFVVAEVVNDFAKKLVEYGEVSGFSWMGFCIKTKEVNKTAISKIDLIEISIVHIQNERNATFVLSDLEDPLVYKEVDLREYDLYQLRFNKEDYSIENIERITKNLKLDSSNITSKDDTYIIDNGSKQPVASFSLQLGKWNIIAAPRIKNEIVLNKINSNPTERLMDNEKTPAPDATEKAKIKEKLFLVDIERFVKQNPKAVVSAVQKTLTLGEDTEIDIHFIELPISDILEEEVEQVIEQLLPVVQPEIVENVKEDVSETKTDVQNQLDILTSVMTSLASTVENLLKSQEQFKENMKVAEEALKEELQRQLETKLQAVSDQKKEVETQKSELQKTLDRISAFENSAPEETTRTEKEGASKNLKQPTKVLDPIDYFAAKIFGGIQ